MKQYKDYKKGLLGFLMFINIFKDYYIFLHVLRYVKERSQF